jgi:hypothetical protein
VTKTLKVDDSNDIYVDASGALAIAEGLVAVMQAAQQSAQTQLGEMVYAVDQGIPNFTSIWNGAPNLAQFEAYLRRAMLGVDGVLAIDSLAISSTEGKVSYSATIQTIYGPGVLNV